MKKANRNNKTKRKVKLIDGGRISEYEIGDTEGKRTTLSNFAKSVDQTDQRASSEQNDMLDLGSNIVDDNVWLNRYCKLVDNLYNESDLIVQQFMMNQDSMLAEFYTVPEAEVGNYGADELLPNGMIKDEAKNSQVIASMPYQQKKDTFFNVLDKHNVPYNKPCLDHQLDFFHSLSQMSRNSSTPAAPPQQAPPPPPPPPSTNQYVIYHMPQQAPPPPIEPGWSHTEQQHAAPPSEESAPMSSQEDDGSHLFSQQSQPGFTQFSQFSLSQEPFTFSQGLSFGSQS